MLGDYVYDRLLKFLFVEMHVQCVFCCCQVVCTMQ